MGQSRLRPDALRCNLLANFLTPRHSGFHVNGSRFCAFFPPIPIADGRGFDRAGSERGAEFHEPLHHRESRLAFRLDVEIELRLFDSGRGHRSFDFQGLWTSHGVDPHFSGR
jgi:hypothetical protein